MIVHMVRTDKPCENCGNQYQLRGEIMNYDCELHLEAQHRLITFIMCLACIFKMGRGFKWKMTP